MSVLGKLHPHGEAIAFPIGAALILQAHRASRYMDWLYRRRRQKHPGAPSFRRVELYLLSESIHARSAEPANYVLLTRNLMAEP